MNESTVKHLEFIQAVITRMNTNSFQLKEWAVAIVSALLAIFASTKDPVFILVSIMPVVVFWFLDAYYLTQERKFRGLYSDVAGISDDPKTLKQFEMRPDLYVGGRYSYINVLRSITILPLYLPLIVILLVAYLYLTCRY